MYVTYRVLSCKWWRCLTHNDPRINGPPPEMCSFLHLSWLYCRISRLDCCILPIFGIGDYQRILRSDFCQWDLVLNFGYPLWGIQGPQVNRTMPRLSWWPRSIWRWCIPWCLREHGQKLMLIHLKSAMTWYELTKSLGRSLHPISPH